MMLEAMKVGFEVGRDSAGRLRLIQLAERANEIGRSFMLVSVKIVVKSSFIGDEMVANKTCQYLFVLNWIFPAELLTIWETMTSTDIVSHHSLKCSRLHKKHPVISSPCY